MKSLSEIQRLLLLGLDLVALAKSARSAGFEVFAVDYFGDYDLVSLCDNYKTVVKQMAGKSCGRIQDIFYPEVLIHLTKEILKENSVDAVLLSSGLDDSFEVLEELEEIAPILGNKSEIFRKVRDKHSFFNEIKRLNLPCPETAVVKNFEETRKAAKDIGYPVIVKPSKGFAGLGVKKAENINELKDCFKFVSSLDNEIVVQKYISGVHASISLISSSNKVRALTINKQLLGIKEAGQSEPFGFCGNIVPFDISFDTRQKCLYISQKIAQHFNLKGSNGVDIVISEKEKLPYIIEVNPRFQATLECVEHILGLNIVKLHIAACLNNHLPNISYKERKYCTRLILFAKDRVKVMNLTNLNEIRDIPYPGAIIEKGEPLCSVVVESNKQHLSFKKALEKANLIYNRFVVSI